MSDANTEALKIALEALKTCDPGESGGFTYEGTYPSYDKRSVENAIAAIEAVLSHPSIAEDGVSFCGGMQVITYVSPQMECDFDDTPPSVAVNVQESEREKPVERGPWRHGQTEDGSRDFIESDDFTHDVRLYIDGDFYDSDQRKAYGEMLAARLNAALSHLPAVQVPQWMPIETAPKGARVLVCGGDVRVPEIANIDGAGNVYLECYEDRRISTDQPDNVPHWMPLPPSPSSKGGE